MKTKEEILQLIHQGEGLKVEAKSAKGGFPDSLWESYSAFANTDGGIILLGVAENKKDGTLTVEGLKDPQKTKKDFWNMVNNRQKVCLNILADSQVHLEDIEDKTILVVEVPRVERLLRPIYKGMDPRTGTYRRNGDGDFLCTMEEVGSMLRDAMNSSVDSEIIEEMGQDVFCQETVKSYRQIFRDTHPTHLWNHSEDSQFLRYLGAATLGKDRMFHPTVAGLLMFGWEYEITRKFPNYFLDYQERKQFMDSRWTDRITSQSGDWSGNLFDFAMKVTNKLQADLKVPFVMRGNFRVDDTPVHKLLREAVTNTLTNADYYGRRGVVIVKDEHGFAFHNPGNMRVAPEDAIQGSISDPRGSTLLKIFSFIKFGERAGSGLFSIFQLWPKIYHLEPTIAESSESVPRTSLFLPTSSEGPDLRQMVKLYDFEQEESIVREDPFGDVPLPSPFEKRWLTGYPGAPKTTAKKSLRGMGDDLAKEIKRILSENPYCSIDALVELCGVSKSTITRQIKAMPELVHRGPKKGGYWEICR
ncbi:MAG: putative DNA binding domain-containing protein [Bacteroidales bacterium]|nr:putative DNA binding domain-containing protein [Bacteroidales bacterium]